MIEHERIIPRKADEHGNTTDRRPQWRPGSARVEGTIESNHPTWVLSARMGNRWRIDLASGPLYPRALAQRIADALNELDPDQWETLLLNLNPTAPERMFQKQDEQ